MLTPIKNSKIAAKTFHLGIMMILDQNTEKILLGKEFNFSY